jgi:hypothetical protein
MLVELILLVVVSGAIIVFLIALVFLFKAAGTMPDKDE